MTKPAPSTSRVRSALARPLVQDGEFGLWANRTSTKTDADEHGDRQQFVGAGGQLPTR